MTSKDACARNGKILLQALADEANRLVTVDKLIFQGNEVILTKGEALKILHIPSSE